MGIFFLTWTLLQHIPNHKTDVSISVYQRTLSSSSNRLGAIISHYLQFIEILRVRPSPTLYGCGSVCFIIKKKCFLYVLVTRLRIYWKDIVVYRDRGYLPNSEEPNRTILRAQNSPHQFRRMSIFPWCQQLYGKVSRLCPSFIPSNIAATHTAYRLPNFTIRLFRQWDHCMFTDTKVGLPRSQWYDHQCSTTQLCHI